MSIDYAQTIADLEDQRALIDQAIAGLRALMTGVPRQAAPVAPKAEKPKARAPKPARPAKEPKPTRPTGASSDSHSEAVLAALAHGPRLMKELQARTKLSRYLLSKALDALQAQKRVTVNGHTSERRVELT